MIRIADIGLEIHEVMNGNIRYLDELIDLYLELFPKYERYANVMRHRAVRPVDAVSPFIEHQWLARMNDAPAGVLVFKYNKKRNCGLGLDLGVRQGHRLLQYGKYTRLAKLLIDLRHARILEDAKLSGNSPPPGLLVEVESPKVVRQFAEYGMIQLPVRYFEPPAPESLNNLIDSRYMDSVGFKPMSLGVYPLGEDRVDLLDTPQLMNFVKAILLDHYGLSDQHWVVREAFESILNKENR